MNNNNRRLLGRVGRFGLLLIVLSVLTSCASALTINWAHDEGVNNAVIGYSDLGAAYDQNATLQGGAIGWLTNCMDGGCYDYNAENAIIPDSYIHLDNWTAFTIGAWVNKSTEHGYFFSDGHFSFRSDGHSFACGLEDGVLVNTSVTAIDDGVFHHLACSWNGTCLNIYYEGVLNGQTCQEHLVYNYTGNTCIGSNCGGGGMEDKVIDALFLADYAMTDGEIYSIYDANDGAPTTTEVTTTVETTSSSELSSSSSEQSSSSSEESSSSIVYASTSSSEQSSSSSSEESSSSIVYASTSSSEQSSSSSSEESSSSIVYASTSSSAVSSSSSSMGSSSTSSVISSTLVTTTLLDCEGDYTLACFILNETVCGDYFSTYEYEHYQCSWNVDFCDMELDGCTLNETPPCNDYETDSCDSELTEEGCESSYVQYIGEGVVQYDCQWIFGWCYEEYEQCAVVLSECPSEYIYGCPIINNSRDCISAYSTWGGYYYQCEWVIDEEFGDYCWFGPNCEKLTFDQCNPDDVVDCYEIVDEGECGDSYVEGRSGYGWDCVWYDGYCYYGDACHEGSPVTTTLPVQTLYDVVEGLPAVGSAISEFIIAFAQVILALIIVSAIAELFHKFSDGLKLR